RRAPAPTPARRPPDVHQTEDRRRGRPPGRRSVRRHRPARARRTRAPDLERPRPDAGGGRPGRTRARRRDRSRRCLGAHTGRSGATPNDPGPLVLWATQGTAPCGGGSVAGSCVSSQGEEGPEPWCDGFNTVTDRGGLRIVEGRFGIGKRTGPFVEYHANGAVA